MPRSPLPAVALLLAVLAILAWLFWPPQGVSPGPFPSTLSDVAAPAGVADAGSGEAVPSAGHESATELLRTAAEQSSAAPTDGTALVRITTRTSEGHNLAGVLVQARRIEGRQMLPTFGRGLTDAEGILEFRGVAPGKLHLTSDRGDYKNVDVTAGRNEVVFEVKAGVDVRGRVLTTGGATVPGATIWLQTSGTDWDGGRVLGIADGDGTFALADVPSDCSLGAWAAGFAPSALVDLDIVDKSAPPARVELVLQQGGAALIGRVTDVAGAPIAGAQVAVGKHVDRMQHEGRRVVEQWTVRLAETDADGRYVVPGLCAGKVPVTARAAGFGIWRGEANLVAGETTTVDIGLPRSVTLLGTVTEKGGAPEARARVSAFDRQPGTHFLAGGQIDFDETFGHQETIADERGNYRLEGVTPGTVWVFAQRRQEGFGGVSVALARTTLELTPGGEVRWDPVIDPGRSIEGVVRYRDGYPIPHLFITLHDERTGEDQVINSDKEGTFRFLCLEDSTYEIRVQPPFDAPRANEAPRRSGVLPDRGRVELQVEYDKPVKQQPGTVRGRIDDAGGRIRNINAVSVTLHSDAGWFRPGVKVENGAFRFTDVKPCRFRISLKESDAELASTDWFLLPAAGDVDIGMVTTVPGGGIRILVDRKAGAEDYEPKLYVRRDGAADSTTVVLGRRDEALVDNLTPGDYEISGYLKGMVAVKAKATVTVAATTDVTIALQAGAAGKIDVWWPENHTTSKTRGYRIVDAADQTALTYEGPLHTAPTRPYELHYALGAGNYRCEFWTDDGLRGGLDFVIPASLQPPALRMDLK